MKSEVDEVKSCRKIETAGDLVHSVCSDGIYVGCHCLMLV